MKIDSEMKDDILFLWFRTCKQLHAHVHEKVVVQYEAASPQVGIINPLWAQIKSDIINSGGSN